MRAKVNFRHRSACLYILFSINLHNLDQRGTSPPRQATKSDTVRDGANNAFLTTVSVVRITKTSWLKGRLFVWDCEKKIGWWFWLKSSSPRWSEKRWQLREYLVDILLHCNRPPWESVNLSPPMFLLTVIQPYFWLFLLLGRHSLGTRFEEAEAFGHQCSNSQVIPETLKNKLK